MQCHRHTETLRGTAARWPQRVTMTDCSPASFRTNNTSWRIDKLFFELVKYNSPKVFNPSRDRCQEFDVREDAADQRRKRLRAHLSTNAACVIGLGEAPGYQRSLRRNSVQERTHVTWVRHTSCNTDSPTDHKSPLVDVRTIGNNCLVRIAGIRHCRTHHSLECIPVSSYERRAAHAPNANARRAPGQSCDP